MTRGCPRNCDFCIVGKKEGLCSVKVADLDEFWRNQKNIKLLDPNITACRECEELFEQLIDSKAQIDFTQGLDIRMMTEEKAKLIKQMKIRDLHFAFDKYEQKDIIIPKLEMFSRIYEQTRSKCVVYILANFDTTIEQDLERIYTVRDLGYTPYLMLYQKDKIPRGHIYRQMQRWVNNKFIFRSCNRFEDYNRKEQIEIKGQQTLF